MSNVDLPAPDVKLLRRLRARMPAAIDPAMVDPAVAKEPANAARPRWTDDLRLFAIAWAAGFLFFMAIIA